MTLQGNPYGFYSDRTKYPLDNLDGQLFPAPHKHVLADIIDYDPDDESPSWVQGYISPTGQTSSDDPELEYWDPVSIMTSDDNPIAVEAGVKYYFAVNQGYQGRILLWDENGNFVPLSEFNVPPQIYPRTWECPEDGTVRILVQKLGATTDSAYNLTPAMADQTGMIFRKISVEDIAEVITKETEESNEYYYQEIRVGSVWRKFALYAYRRGHNATLYMTGYTGALTPNDWCGILVPQNNWYKCEGFENWGENPTPVNMEVSPSGLPSEFFPAGVVGDYYVNSDRPNMQTARLWANPVGPTSAGSSSSLGPLSQGDIIIWCRPTDTVPNGAFCVSTMNFVCRGRE